MTFTELGLLLVLVPMLPFRTHVHPATTSSGLVSLRSKLGLRLVSLRTRSCLVCPAMVTATLSRVQSLMAMPKNLRSILALIRTLFLLVLAKLPIRVGR